MNDDYTDGIICPYEIPDQWQYEYDRQWYVGGEDFFMKKIFKTTKNRE